MIIVKNIDNLSAVGAYQSFTFNFEFDNASTLPTRTYQLGLSTYIISDGSTAKNIVNNNTYVYQKGSWVKTFSGADKETKSDYIINNPYMGYIYNVGEPIPPTPPTPSTVCTVDFTEEQSDWSVGDVPMTNPTSRGVLVTASPTVEISGTDDTKCDEGAYVIKIEVDGASNNVLFNSATLTVNDTNMTTTPPSLVSWDESNTITFVGNLSDASNFDMNLAIEGLTNSIYIKSISVEKVSGGNVSIYIAQQPKNIKCGQDFVETLSLAAVSTDASATLSYTWEYSDSSDNWTSLSDVTTSYCNPDTSNAGTVKWRCIVTASNGDTLTSDVVDVTVMPEQASFNLTNPTEASKWEYFEGGEIQSDTTNGLFVEVTPDVEQRNVFTIQTAKKYTVSSGDYSVKVVMKSAQSDFIFDGSGDITFGSAYVNLNPATVSSSEFVTLVGTFIATEYDEPTNAAIVFNMYAPYNVYIKEISISGDNQLK